MHVAEKEINGLEPALSSSVVFPELSWGVGPCVDLCADGEEPLTVWMYIWGVGAEPKFRAENPVLEEYPVVGFYL